MKIKFNSLRGHMLNSYQLRNNLNPFIFFITLFFTNFVYSQTPGSITFGNIDEEAKIIEINYSSSVEFAGFQFTLSGIVIDDLDGGAAEDYGLQVSGNEQEQLGFVLFGEPVPAGSGLLTYLHYSEISDQACFVEAILSPPGGGYICGDPNGSISCNDGD